MTSSGVIAVAGAGARHRGRTKAQAEAGEWPQLIAPADTQY